MHEMLARAVFEDQVRGLTPRLAKERDWVLHSTTYPELDCEFRAPNRTPMRLQFDCTHWNEQPVPITMLTADGQLRMSIGADATSMFNGGPHRDTGRPFICMRGSFDYHRHECHTGDHWDALRNAEEHRLDHLLTRLWRAWLKGTV